VSGLDGIVHDVPGCSGAASLTVRVIARAGTTKFGGIRDGCLLVRLAAAPVDGAANASLVSFLSKSLGIPLRTIAIAAGEHNRHKRVVLGGMSGGEAKRRLAKLLANEGFRPSSTRRDSG
jgi:hypothetical protein